MHLFLFAILFAPQYETMPNVKASGMAGYASMLVVKQPQPEPKPESKAKPDEPVPNVAPVAPPKPRAKPQPTHGYWRTECNGGSCRRVWVPQSPQRTYHYRGLFRRR